jgi:hypothetical protein
LVHLASAARPNSALATRLSSRGRRQADGRTGQGRGDPRPGGRRSRAGSLACGCALLALTLTAAPAQAITFSQQTLPFTGLSVPQGVAVDQAGDVFAADSGNNRALELPAGSNQPAVLPFTGLSFPTGVAVDQAANGSYLVRARCVTAYGLATQNYASGPLTVGPASGGSQGPPGPQGPTGSTGPQGPAGPQGATGAQGSPGSNGTNGAAGPAGPKEDKGPAGPAGPAGAAAPKLTGETIKCTTTLVATNCTVTSPTPRRWPAPRAQATAKIKGKTRVVGTGRIRNHKLKLKFKHLHRGRYRLTLNVLRAHHKRG